MKVVVTFKFDEMSNNFYREHPPPYNSESIELFLEDQAFSGRQDVSLSPSSFTDGREGEGLGVEPNHAKARKPVPL
jgi:hypothetical protein